VAELHEGSNASLALAYSGAGGFASGRPNEALYKTRPAQKTDKLNAALKKKSPHAEIGYFLPSCSGLSSSAKNE
jgi:hypothetical protein